MINKRNVKICVFEKNTPKDIVLLGNGDAILDKICVQCTVLEGLDGTNELDAIFIADNNGLYKHIDDEVILKVQMDYGDEIYRVVKASKQEKKISVFARQITISETLDMWIEDVRPTNKNGLSALTNIKDDSIGKKDIEVFSDIDDLNTAYYQRMSMYQAIHDCDQSFLSRWGGEIQRRRYNLTINKRIGQDRGVEIRSKKNLTGFEANTDIDNVVTRIRAVGYDGIYAGKYVDSPLINKYSSIKTREIEYSDVKVRDENNPDEGFPTLAEAQNELIRRAELEFAKNKIDELRAEYRINFIYLEQTEEYKDFVQAERVYLGDTVSVYEDTYDINIHVRVISRRYDVLNQKVLEIELSNSDISNKTLTTSDILSELQSIISNSNNNNVQDIIQSMINSGIKDSYVVPRQNEIIVADNKDLNLANNVIRLNKNGLGFSKTGYYGQYEYGFTIDGIINASLIQTGILNADLIKAGVLSAITIQNSDGSLQIDLSKPSGIVTKKNGKNAIELAGTIMKFYDWDGGDAIGQLYSARVNGNEKVPGIVLANKKDSYLSLSYEKGNSFYNYIKFDKDNIDNLTSSPITIYQETDFRGAELWFGYNINSIYNSATNNLVLKAKNNLIVGDLDSTTQRFNLGKNALNLWDVTDNNRYCLISPNESFFGGKGRKYFECSPTGFAFWQGTDDIFYTTTADTIQSDRGFHVNGDFTVNGNKNCIQSTENYGDVLYYSVEDCESYLTDRSMELFTVEETDNNTYERVILLDNIFKESINLDLDYTVDIIKYGWGDYRIKEQTKNYFIVESDRKDFTFKYVITGKRKGFENERNNAFYKGVKSINSSYINKINNLEDDNNLNVKEGEE